MSRELLFVALGGALGALARHLLATAGARWLGPLPWATLGVNALGGLALGALVGGDWGLSPALRAGLGAGFCGALTTFSTFSVDTLRLLGAGQPGLAAGNVLLNLALGLGGAALGLALSR